MMGKMLKKSKTLSQIDLDKPIIKPHYYPISKAGILTERNDVNKAKVSIVKGNTIANIDSEKRLPPLKHETITEERNENDGVNNKKGNELKNVKLRGVDSESLRTDKSKGENLSGILKRTNTEVVMKNMRKNTGVAAEGERFDLISRFELNLMFDA